MSPLTIVLLILILSVCSSSYTRRSDIEKNETQLIVNNEKSKKVRSSLERVNTIIDRRGSRREHDLLKKLNGEKLSKKLQQRMRILMKRIIQRGRDELSKKWPNKKKEKKKNTNFNNSIRDRCRRGDGTPILKFPVAYQLERGNKMDRDDYSSMIGQTRRGIQAPISIGDLVQVSRNLIIPLIRKVGRNLGPIEVQFDGSNEREAFPEKREKRASRTTDAWIKKDFKDHDKSFKMHALVVREQDIPPCCSPAKQVTNERYFMCSGAVLTLKHAITTASCMHFADVYKTDVKADLGIFVGATSPRAYVIKINRYEMHPDYNYDVDAADYAFHNLAIIYLDCNIVPQDVAVPSLPKGANDDVPHLCCGNHCNIFTIVQSHDNRHAARILKAKHVPAPRHTEELAIDPEIPNTRFGVSKPSTNELNDTFIIRRRIRSSSKLAAAPLFFGIEPRSSSSSISSPIPKPDRSGKQKITQRKKNMGIMREKDLLNLEDFVKRIKSKNSQSPFLRALKGVNVEKELAAVDWSKVEQTMASRFTEGNRQAMELFSKNVVDETMRRLEIVFSDDNDDDDDDDINSESGGSGESVGSNGGSGGTSSSKGSGDKIFSRLLPKKKHQTVTDFVKVFTSVVTSLLPPNNNTAIVVSDDPTINENEVDDPSPAYEDCPPLGSPVIINETLIGLLAYTCDDAQNWVEWKYVNIGKNMNWLRRKISEQYEPKGKCSGTEKSSSSSPQTRSLPMIQPDGLNEENIWEIKNRNEYVERNFGWTRSGKEMVHEKRRDDLPRNLNSVPVTKTSFKILQDPWFGRNLQPAAAPPLQARSSRPRISVLHNDVPVYNFNTCYVKPNGNIDCATTKTQFDNR